MCEKLRPRELKDGQPREEKTEFVALEKKRSYTRT